MGPEACDYLTQAFKVECTKDSTTPGSVIELLDRVLGVHSQLADRQGMAVFAEDMEGCIRSFRDRGWESRERDVFALLLYKVATALLMGDDGTGIMLPRALNMLKDAETNLKIYISFTKNKEELKAHTSRRHSGNTLDSGEAGKERIDVDVKQFGPRADSVELLKQIQNSIRFLEIGDKSSSGFQDMPNATFAAGNSGTAPVGNSAGPTLSQQQQQQPQPWAVTSEPPRSVAEADSEALARTYALVGNWSNWGTFVELQRDEGDGTVFSAEVVVPAGKDVEFQVVCDGDWKQRLFPTVNGGGGRVLGPTSDGHGRNWRLHGLTDPAILRVDFDPTGERYLRSALLIQP